MIFHQKERGLLGEMTGPSAGKDKMSLLEMKEVLKEWQGYVNSTQEPGSRAFPLVKYGTTEQ